MDFKCSEMSDSSKNEDADIYLDGMYRICLEEIKEENEKLEGLKEITQNQLENIRELQKECEESSIAISQLPKVKKIAAERFVAAMKEAGIVQISQLQVNDLLNVSMREFDETIALINKSNEQFLHEVEQAKEREMIYSSNLVQIKLFGDSNIACVKNRINKKLKYLASIRLCLEEMSDQPNEQSLSLLKSNLQHLLDQNSQLEKELSKIDFQDKSIHEDTEKRRAEVEAIIESTQDELMRLNVRSDELRLDVSKFDYDLDNINATKEEVKENCKTLNENILQENMKQDTLEKEILEKKDEISALKNELQLLSMTSIQLIDRVREVNTIEALCFQIQDDIDVLEKEKAHSVTSLEQLVFENTALEEKLYHGKNDVQGACTALESLKSSFESNMKKVNQFKETHDVELKSGELIMKDNEILLDQVTMHNLDLKGAISLKIKKIEELKASLKHEIEKCSLMEEEIKIHKNINSRKESLNKDLSTMKSKCCEIYEILSHKTVVLKSKKEESEKLATLSQQIEEQKNKTKQILEDFLKEKIGLKMSFNEKLENQLTELQKSKEGKQCELDKAKDSASRAEFEYCILKSLAQSNKSEFNCTKDTLKTCNCENAMLRSLIMWVETVTDVSSAHDSGNSSDSEEQEDFEASSANDMSRQSYHLSKSEMGSKEGLGTFTPFATSTPNTKTYMASSSQGNMYPPEVVEGPAPKKVKKQSVVSTQRRTAAVGLWRKPHKEKSERTILERIIESADSQSSA